MPHSRAKLTRFLLTACLLASFLAGPARAQGTAGETFKIIDSGHFPVIDVDNRGGFVLAWTNIMDSNQEIYGGLLGPVRSIVTPLFVVNIGRAGIQTFPGSRRVRAAISWWSGREAPSATRREETGTGRAFSARRSAGPEPR